MTLLFLLFAIISNCFAADMLPFQLSKTISLPNVEGRIDHMSVDLEGKRLFVAALGNNTVEVIDINKGQQVHTISDLSEPQGVLYVTEFNQIIISNGESGTCEFYNGTTYKNYKSVAFGEDADNLRYDSLTMRAYVGFGNGALGVIDLSTGLRSQSAEVKLSGHPESFQLEKNGKHIFVNVPDAQHIAVIDREKNKLETTWSLEGNSTNFPMALDETNHRLFVGCRVPPKLLVFDTQSGKIITQLDCPSDPDDVFYDSPRQRIYMTCGAGVLAVILQTDPDHYELISQIETAKGARTSLWVSELETLFVAVPHRDEQQTEIREYTFVKP